MYIVSHFCVFCMLYYPMILWICIFSFGEKNLKFKTRCQLMHQFNVILLLTSGDDFSSFYCPCIS